MYAKPANRSEPGSLRNAELYLWPTGAIRVFDLGNLQNRAREKERKEERGRRMREGDEKAGGQARGPSRSPGLHGPPQEELEKDGGREIEGGESSEKATGGPSDNGKPFCRCRRS